MLLGVLSPPDMIDVEEQPGQDGPFVARLTIVQFEKRMNVSGEIAFEFTARGMSLPRIGLSSSRHPRYHVFHTFGRVFPFSTREDMETEVPCNEERSDTPTW